ncbi:hypothetical protein EST38_g10383 [Candolleomyces aberdarensis]|uniref:Uncharacterized protein n=1 Tax=Candolleomyces aberdarensis TaxID=2316362 RepID=A0A4Q2D7I6_9AGAR|nr:hypothetical protein EST38_g10383 [Candolleomyces aberdarensis]
MLAVKNLWQSYTFPEKRDIGIYIAGIMFYKFGLEFFNGSFSTLAPERWKDGKPFMKLGGAQGLNQAAQCVGAILIAPLVKKWPTRTVLSAAIIMFSLTAGILLIVDTATGGKFKDPNTHESKYGTWTPNLIFLFWTVSGICYGMVELIRRVIPVDIVGGDVDKLRCMDAMVHIFYEIAGTGGAVASWSAITQWGDNKSFLLTPVSFAFAGVTWWFISTLSFARERGVSEEVEAAGLAVVDRSQKPTTNYLVTVGRGFRSFGDSVWVGARLIFTNRCFIWLIPSYSVALYLHRFLENNLAPAFARRVLGKTQLSQIIVGGSNLGEASLVSATLGRYLILQPQLLGALSVLMLSDTVPTPLPWLRFDAVALNLVWVVPAFARIATQDAPWAWKVAGFFIPISMGWAAGEVSLAAYIQSVLSESAFHHERVSALGSVMVRYPSISGCRQILISRYQAFLYTTYIVLYAALGVALGKVIDDEQADIKKGLTRVGGVQFSVSCVIILASTFVPKGARSFNPKTLGTITTGATPDQSDSELGSINGRNDDRDIKEGLSISRGNVQAIYD